MPGTLKRIRDEMDVKPTPRGKGLTLTLRVTAYDNGMIEVDGVPDQCSASLRSRARMAGRGRDSAAHARRVPQTG